jgi:hypothetical protein
MTQGYKFPLYADQLSEVRIRNRIRNNNNNNNNNNNKIIKIKKEKTYTLRGAAIPADRNVTQKEAEKKLNTRVYT